MAAPEKVPVNRKEQKETDPIPKVESNFYRWADLEGEKNPLRNALIGAYQRTFRGGPWNEYRACDNAECEQVYSENKFATIYKEHSNKESCECVICNQGKLTDAHTTEKIQSRLKSELGKPEAFLLISGIRLPEPTRENETILIDKTQTEVPVVSGFSWGFTDRFDRTMNYMMTNYFPAADPQRLAQIGDGVNSHLNNPAKLTYVSEFGVVNNHRGTGLSFDMMDQLADKILADRNDPYVCWTSRGKTQTEIQRQFGLTSDDKVIMAGKFQDLDDVFSRDYQPDDPDRQKKVFRRIALGTEKLNQSERVNAQNFHMFRMLMGFGAERFAINEKGNS